MCWLPPPGRLLDLINQGIITLKHIEYFVLDEADKKDLLVHILKEKSIDQVLLFSRTKHGADKIARNLKKKNINTAAIHGSRKRIVQNDVLSCIYLL
jgi:ATP-dependent RNA helicase RhlE